MPTSTTAIDHIKRQLHDLETRKGLLQDLLASYQKLAQLDGSKRDVKPKGAVSLRGAVLQVIKDAASAIKPADIWIRVQELGAASHAKDPVAIVDLMACQLRKTKPLKKTAEGWLYTG